MLVTLFLSAPSHATVLEPVKDAPAWSRQVLRPSSEVQVVQQGSQLLLTGRAGSVKLDLTQLDPTGLVAFKLLQVGNRATLILASPDKARFQVTGGSIVFCSVFFSPASEAGG